MPIYEYQCPSCGHRFDAIQKFSDDPIRVCPQCGKDEVKKLVSATSFVLKGGGWYKDHYGLKPGGASESSGGSSSASSSGSTSEASAPAASAPAAPAAAPASAPASTPASTSK